MSNIIRPANISAKFGNKEAQLNTLEALVTKTGN